MRPRWIPLPLCPPYACAAHVEPDNDTDPDPDPVVVELPVPDEALVCIATAGVGAAAVPAWFVVAAACSLSGGMCVDTCLEIL